MSDQINIHTGGPSVALARIDRILTYEVQEMELDKLDSLVSTEISNLAFTTFTAGVLVAAFLGWLAAEKLSPAASAIYVGVMFASGVLTVWLGLSWLRARRDRPRLLETIKERARSKIAPMR